MGFALQTLVSLAAVLAIAALVRGLGLGASPRIRDAADAIRLAEEAEAGFGAVEACVDADGHAAVARNAMGQRMVLRPHGAHVAARRIADGPLPAAGRVTIETGDARFGSVTLDTGGAAR